MKDPSLFLTINHMLKRGSKIFSCFLDVRKAFDTVWIDGLLDKLLSDIGISFRTKSPRTKSPGQNPPGQNPP